MLTELVDSEFEEVEERLRLHLRDREQIEVPRESLVETRSGRKGLYLATAACLIAGLTIVLMSRGDGEIESAQIETSASEVEPVETTPTVTFSNEDGNEPVDETPDRLGVTSDELLEQFEGLYYKDLEAFIREQDQEYSVEALVLPPRPDNYVGTMPDPPRIYLLFDPPGHVVLPLIDRPNRLNVLVNAEGLVVELFGWG